MADPAVERDIRRLERKLADIKDECDAAIEKVREEIADVKKSAAKPPEVKPVVE